MSGELPPGWVEVTGHDLFEFVTSGSRGWAKYHSPDGAKFIRVGNLGRAGVDIDFSDIQHVSPPDGAEGERTIVKPGDVLITITADLGRVGVVGNDVGHAYVNQHVALVRPVDRRSSRFIGYFIQSHSGQSQLGLANRGATRAGLGLDDIRGITLPLPPLPEQHRIVERIEALLAKGARAKAALDALPPLLDRYRQSLLAAAFRGDLTADWRKEQTAYTNPDDQSLSDLPPVPEGWRWETFESAVKSSLNGFGRRTGEGGVATPVIRLADISSNKIVRSGLRCIGMSEKEIEKYALRKNDVLCIRVNGSASLVGRFLSTENAGGLAFCDHFIRFTIESEKFDPNFVIWWFETDYIRDLVEGVFVSSAGQKTVSQGTLSRIPIPAPSLPEQRMIVEIIAKNLRSVETIGETLEMVEFKHTTLTQSILAKAFRGELVPQDPADEPASVLLARIRAERAVEKPKRGRARKEA